MFVYLCVDFEEIKRKSLPGQGFWLQGRRCLKGPGHRSCPEGFEGFMHLRTLDCNPDPQDLLHLEYDPHCVHTPWIEAWAEFDPTLSSKNKMKDMMWIYDATRGVESLSVRVKRNLKKCFI